jgi:ABC-type Fe3+ transport system substrate-binding protein
VEHGRARLPERQEKARALAKILRVGSLKEGQVMLGNQAAVPKGAPHPNAGKLLLEFLLTKEGADVFVGGEAVYSFREGYTPPAHVRPYLLDLSKTKLLGLKDWIGAAKKVKGIRNKWTAQFK